ncbi:MAG: SLC13 family permease, partial [Desulfovibrionaceae bacterium]|nr:SLC13 family permease [Desulfovibrionaceae bacterium]
MVIKTEQLTPALMGKWALSIAAAAAVYFLLPRSDALTDVMCAFLAATTWAVVVWGLDIMDNVMVGLLLPVFYMMACGVPHRVVLAPWLSDTAILVIGGFSLGKIIQSTGLGRRIALACVRRMGGSFAGVLAGITVGAAIIAPFVPSIVGKGAIFLAIVISLCDEMGFRARSREATAIMLATCFAICSTKMGYLTGAGDLFMGMGLVDKAMGFHTTWVQYFQLHFPPAVLYTVMSLGIVLVVLRTKTDRKALKAAAEAKYAELGPIGGDEKMAVALFALTLLLLATDSVHHLTPGIVLILIMGIAFLPGIGLLDRPKLLSINFTPLFFIMGCMAIGSTGAYLKVTDWLVGLVEPFFAAAGSDLSVMGSYAVGVLVNFLLTPMAATSALSAPIAEIGAQIGMDPRVLYFSFQYGLDNLIFPYEHVLYLFFFSAGYINFREMALVMGLRMLLC